MVREYEVPARDPAALARALQHWTQHNITYVREYPETIATPERTIEWGIGDCDDMTVLLCSALRSARIPARAVFSGWQDAGGTGPIPYRHVYPQAALDGRWVTHEVVRPVPPGWDATKLQFRRGKRVTVDTIGDPRTHVADAWSTPP